MMRPGDIWTGVLFAWERMDRSTVWGKGRSAERDLGRLNLLLWGALPVLAGEAISYLHGLRDISDS